MVAELYCAEIILSKQKIVSTNCNDKRSRSGTQPTFKCERFLFLALLEVIYMKTANRSFEKKGANKAGSLVVSKETKDKLFFCFMSTLNLFFPPLV